jgi:hypothetical protein
VTGDASPDGGRASPQRRPLIREPRSEGLAEAADGANAISTAWPPKLRLPTSSAASPEPRLPLARLCRELGTGRMRLGGWARAVGLFTVFRRQGTENVFSWIVSWPTLWFN